MSQPSPALSAPQHTPGPTDAGPRPFRLKLRGHALAIVRLPNQRQVRTKLHQISTSGGLLNVEAPLDEKLPVELIFHLNEVTIRAAAETLFPMWATHGWMQPFRFVDLSEANKTSLHIAMQASMNPKEKI